MEQELSVDLLCLHCQEQLRGETNKIYKPGDTIKCDSCGELNDYERVIEIAQQKVVELIKSQTEGDMTITLDKPDEK
ncbi:MAG: hypothetical protein JSU75_02500 [Gammaproteobacteria bacterium]|nr:MAG: hypothetical protein JSU75_02500 [Gammaproteobacteria bacterium]